MAKDKITDYDATAANNTDIGGVNIQGTAAISNADNAFREQMSHLAETNAGTYPVDDTWSFCDPADKTKKFRFDGGSITAGQTRVVTMPDANVTIPSGVLVTEAATQTLLAKTLTSPTITAPTLSTSVLLTGVISPAQITSNQNDYAPTGHATASVFRLTSDATRDITGLAGGVAGRIAIFQNVGSQWIVLIDEGGGSTAANRFDTSDAGNVLLFPSHSALLYYDGTSSRWRVFNSGPSLPSNATVEAASSFSTYVAPANQQYHPSAAKCWGEFNGNSTTVLASYNITGVADTATGAMTVTIANDFTDANWACLVCRAEDDLTLVYSATYDAKAAGTVILRSAVEAGSGSDPSSASGNASWSFAGYGDQP